MSSDIFSGIGSLIGTAFGGPLGGMLGNLLGDMIGQLFNTVLDGAMSSLGLPQSAQDAIGEGFKGGFNFNFGGK